jgi:hypothetical protein
MRTKWSEADKRAFTEQKLRAQTIPMSRFDGPKADEWAYDEVVISSHARSQRPVR